MISTPETSNDMPNASNAHVSDKTSNFVDPDKNSTDLSADIATSSSSDLCSQPQPGLTTEVTLGAAAASELGSQACQATTAVAEEAIPKSNTSRSHSEPPVVVDHKVIEPIPAALTLGAKNMKLQLEFLRHQSQKGLLPENQDPKTKPTAEDMREMSPYPEKLEGIVHPSGSALRGVRLQKVLKAIKNRMDIPPEADSDFKGRAARLLEKWNSILSSTEQPTISATADDQAVYRSKPLAHDSELPVPEQPVIETVVHGESLGSAPIEVELELRLDFERLLNRLNKALDEDDGVNPESTSEERRSILGCLTDLKQIVGPSAIYLAKIPKVLHAIKELDSDLAHHHQFNSRATYLLKKWDTVWNPQEQSAVEQQAKRAPGVVIIDLTGESDSEELTQPMDPREEPTGENLSSPKNSHEPASSPEFQNSLGQALSTKRKHSKASSRTISASNSSTALASSGDKAPTRRHTRPRTSFQKHLNDESVFAKSSLREIEGCLKDNTEEIELVRKKRLRLMEENDEEMKLIQKKRVRLTAFKENLLAWGAQDEKVTKEWEGRV